MESDAVWIASRYETNHLMLEVGQGFMEAVIALSREMLPINVHAGKVKKYF